MSLTVQGPTLELRLEEQARSLGFSLFGVADADSSDHMAFYREWIGRGYHGEMGYLARGDSLARRADLGGTMEDVQSVIVVGHEYYQHDDPGRVSDPTRGVIARYARGADYHDVVRKKLQALLRWLDAEVEGGVHGRPYVDTGPILERELARRAGLGWFGRNTMLINPERGSYFFLGVILVDARLRPSPPFHADRCGSCRACLDACPTGALLGRDAKGAPVMDARRCISYLTIELRGPIPEDLRRGMGNRVYGCDICQEVCPWNGSKFVEVAGEARYRPEWRRTAEPDVAVERVPASRTGHEDSPSPSAVPSTLPSTQEPSLVDLIRMTRAEWDAWTRGSPIRRTGYGGFRRNVAVAMGNWIRAGETVPAEAEAALREALDDPDELVRVPAAWALAGLSAAVDEMESEGTD